VAREFKNLREVATYLRDEGWKVSKSTVYEHSKKGMIRPDVEKKRYSLKAVLKYAQTHLVPLGTVQKKKDEDLQRQKTLAEIERIQEQTRREKINRLKAEGALIEKESVYLELAARGAVLEAGLKGMVQARAGDWVTLVHGDEKKTADLVRELMTEIDLTVNEFATTKEFQVVFE
jgi:phosphotransacetylase